MLEKKCHNCGELQPLTDFFKERSHNDGYSSQCKICRKEYCKNWRLSHKRELKDYNKKRWAENKEEITAQEKIKQALNPEYRRLINKRSNTKRLSTPKGKIGNSLRKGIHRSLKGSKEGKAWQCLVGYTVNDLKKHLEKLFQVGMTWGNYGPVWHIDHKIPVVAFNYTHPDDIDFKRCWALNNLRPMWASDNIKKKDRVDAPFQPSLLLPNGKIA